ncbi:sodium/glutamate symporter [Pelagibius sp. CAU 1746]|uniref:sodium/glutamate symporter n=1 Tax=Pelagibius sp. CAU 1746 TaxID=3140370 RepID=UPI00325B99B9
MDYTVGGANIVVLAVAVWFAGTFINRKVAFLERYSIPVAVTGGLLCSLAVAAIYYVFDVTIHFDTRLRDLLLLVFFSTIGLSARLSLLKQGGSALVVLLVAAAVLLILQNATGVLLALAFDEHPGYGLFGGSVSLAGGHGTAIAWGAVAEEAGLQGAREIGIAFATFGLIAGGLLGGPIAERLIKRNGLQAVCRKESEGGAAATAEPAVARGLPPISSTLGMLLLLAVCVEAGDLVNQFLFSHGVTLPGFLTAMLVGIVLVNGADLLEIRLDPVTRERASELSLQLFLAMSLMSMQLWVLAGAMGPILLALFAQMAVITLFAVFIVFRAMGGTYDAAVVAAGFSGLGMGATPVGIANMNAVTEKYGPSPKAFLVVPLVGAFFLDLLNALVIKAFLGMEFMQGF